MNQHHKTILTSDSFNMIMQIILDVTKASQHSNSLQQTGDQRCLSTLSVQVLHDSVPVYRIIMGAQMIMQTG